MRLLGVCDAYKTNTHSKANTKTPTQRQTQDPLKTWSLTLPSATSAESVTLSGTGPHGGSCARSKKNTKPNTHKYKNIEIQSWSLCNKCRDCDPEWNWPTRWESGERERVRLGRSQRERERARGPARPQQENRPTSGKYHLGREGVVIERMKSMAQKMATASTTELLLDLCAFSQET